MKKAVLFLISLLLIFTVSCGSNTDINNKDKYKIIVCGTELEEFGYYIDMPYYRGYVMLPFGSILESLGADVEWSSKSKAKVIFNDKVYRLNARRLSFTLEGSHDNYIIPAPGQTEIYHTSDDGVFLLDDTTSRTVVRFAMGIHLSLDVDTDKLVIYLDEAIG